MGLQTVAVPDPSDGHVRDSEPFGQSPAARVEFGPTLEFGIFRPRIKPTPEKGGRNRVLFVTKRRPDILGWSRQMQAVKASARSRTLLSDFIRGEYPLNSVWLRSHLSGPKSFICCEISFAERVILTEIVVPEGFSRIEIVVKDREP